MSPAVVKKVFSLAAVMLSFHYRFLTIVRGKRKSMSVKIVVSQPTASSEGFLAFSRAHEFYELCLFRIFKLSQKFRRLMVIMGRLLFFFGRKSKR